MKYTAILVINEKMKVTNKIFTAKSNYYQINKRKKENNGKQ